MAVLVRGKLPHRQCSQVAPRLQRVWHLASNGPPTLITTTQAFWQLGVPFVGKCNGRGGTGGLIARCGTRIWFKEFWCKSVGRESFRRVEACASRAHSEMQMTFPKSTTERLVAGRPSQ